MGSSKSSTPAKVDPVSEAQANVNAQLQAIPQAAQLNWDVLTNPTYGSKAQTQLQESIRQELFPNESAVRDQLTQNILQSLQSPMGYTPEQQTAVDALRSQAQNELVKALRTRANLGGKLYGGQAGYEEGRAVGDLQNQFVEQDINRGQTNRLNAINSALPLLQLLYPDVNITNPQYINPVVSADTQYSQDVGQRGQDLTYAAQQQANQNALYSALFQGLGTAAGGIF